MKIFILKHEKTINIIFPLIITACIFYSGVIGQEISKIRNDYLIDVVTINNSFITLAINASNQNNKQYQETYNNISKQMEKFNHRYSAEEKTLKGKENFKRWFDLTPYILIFLMIRLNVFFTKNGNN